MKGALVSLALLLCSAFLTAHVAGCSYSAGGIEGCASRLVSMHTAWARQPDGTVRAQAIPDMERAKVICAGGSWDGLTTSVIGAAGAWFGGPLGGAAMRPCAEGKCDMVTGRAVEGPYLGRQTECRNCGQGDGVVIDSRSGEAIMRERTYRNGRGELIWRANASEIPPQAEKVRDDATDTLRLRLMEADARSKRQ